MVFVVQREGTPRVHWEPGGAAWGEGLGPGQLRRKGDRANGEQSS